MAQEVPQDDGLACDPVQRHVVTAPGLQDRYLELLKGCLTRYIFLDEEVQELAPSGWKRRLFAPVGSALARRGARLVKGGGNPEDRVQGRTWPSRAETMVGLHRLDHVQSCVADVLREGIAGDLIETGVWRGGTTILMRAVLAAYGDTSRRVWVADSFQGLPRPGAANSLPEKAVVGQAVTPGIASPWWSEQAGFGKLVVGLDEVKANFAKYGLLDSQVQFLPGWFKDTLGSAPIERLAVMRLDGDWYESTMEALVSLYPKLSVGGWVIIDDFSYDPCRQAVQDYRSANGILEEIQTVDWTAVCWRRLS